MLARAPAYDSAPAAAAAAPAAAVDNAVTPARFAELLYAYLVDKTELVLRSDDALPLLTSVPPAFTPTMLAALPSVRRPAECLVLARRAARAARRASTRHSAGRRTLGSAASIVGVNAGGTLVSSGSASSLRSTSSVLSTRYAYSSSAKRAGVTALSTAAAGAAAAAAGALSYAGARASTASACAASSFACTPARHEHTLRTHRWPPRAAQDPHGSHVRVRAQ